MWIAICAGWILASVLFYSCLIYYSRELPPEDTSQERADDYIKDSISESSTDITAKAA